MRSPETLTTREKEGIITDRRVKKGERMRGLQEKQGAGQQWEGRAAPIVRGSREALITKQEGMR